jgi:hypothetical protein
MITTTSLLASGEPISKLNEVPMTHPDRIKVIVSSPGRVVVVVVVDVVVIPQPPYSI